MSYGIDFTADIFLSRQDYGENVHRVQDEIDDLKKYSQELKERMLMLVAGGKDMVNTKDCEGIDTVQLYDLYLYKEYLENRKDGEKSSET